MASEKKMSAADEAALAEERKDMWNAALDSMEEAVERGFHARITPRDGDDS